MQTQTHQKILYTMHGAQAVALIGAIGFGAVMLAGKPSTEEVPHAYHASAADLSAIPWGAHHYTVFAAPGSGDFPDELADAIGKASGNSKVEPTLDEHRGIFVSPDTPEGRAVADALSKIVGEKVGLYSHIIGDQPAAFEVSVGVPARKVAD